MRIKQEVVYRNTILPIVNKESLVFSLDDKEGYKKSGSKQALSGAIYKNTQSLRLELKDKEENLPNDKLASNLDKNNKVNHAIEIQSMHSVISPKVQLFYIVNNSYYRKIQNHRYQRLTPLNIEKFPKIALVLCFNKKPSLISPHQILIVL